MSIIAILAVAAGSSSRTARDAGPRCQTVCTYPVPSPDGRRISYRKIHERNLTSHAAYDGWPMWSPNGEWIAFASNRGGQPNMSHLFVVRADGKGLRQLTRGAGAFKQHSWASDGRSIYVARTWEADDWSWGFGHVVKIFVDTPAP